MGLFCLHMIFLPGNLVLVQSPVAQLVDLKTGDRKVASSRLARVIVLGS